MESMEDSVDLLPEALQERLTLHGRKCHNDSPAKLSPSFHLPIPVTLSLNREGHLLPSPTATWCVPELAQTPGAQGNGSPAPFVQTWYEAIVSKALLC